MYFCLSFRFLNFGFRRLTSIPYYPYIYISFLEGTGWVPQVERLPSIAIQLVIDWLQVSSWIACLWFMVPVSFNFNVSCFLQRLPFNGVRFGLQNINDLRKTLTMAGKVVVGVGIGVELNSSWKGKKRTIQEWNFNFNKDN